MRLLPSEEPKGQHVNLSCSIDNTKFACGMNNVVVEVVFSDNIYWVARIEVPEGGMERADSAADPGKGREITNDQDLSMFSEIATMKIVRQRTKIPIPEVFAYDAITNNTFGYRYILMETAQDRILESSIYLLPQDHQAK